MKIGIIGLGKMGSRMTQNLLGKEDFEVYIWNRSKEKIVPFIDMGAIKTISPSELAREVDIVITMLSNPKAVESVALGQKGFLDAMSKGSMWIDCSTVNPSFSRMLSQQAQQRGVKFLDAPVSGTTVPAEKGELTFLVGGHYNDVEEAIPIFNMMGNKVRHIGDNGKGSEMKMLVNMLLANSMIGFCESLSLGESFEIEKDTLLDILLELPVSAPYLKAKKENFENDNYTTQFSLDMMYKDLFLASLSSYEEAKSMPNLNLNKEIFAKAHEIGLGKEDFSAIYEYYKDKKNNK